MVDPHSTTIRWKDLIEILLTNANQLLRGFIFLGSNCIVALCGGKYRWSEDSQGKVCDFQVLTLFEQVTMCCD